MIQETIKNEIKAAMKEKNAVKLNTLRSLSAAFTNELVAQRRAPDSPVDDELALKVIKRIVKQHKDSIEQFRAGGRSDLVESETAELSFLEPYLPKTLGKDAIMPIAQAKKAELGVNDKSQMGILMGAVMKELGGNADGADVRAVVESLFS